MKKFYAVQSEKKELYVWAADKQQAYTMWRKRTKNHEAELTAMNLQPINHDTKGKPYMVEVDGDYQLVTARNKKLAKQIASRYVTREWEGDGVVTSCVRLEKYDGLIFCT